MRLSEEEHRRLQRNYRLRRTMTAYGFLLPNAIFFVAFFPQCLDPRRGSTTSQILGLGAIFTLLGLLFDTVWATSAGSVGTWLRRRPTWANRQRLISGGVYLALGATAALTGTSSRG